MAVAMANNLNGGASLPYFRKGGCRGVPDFGAVSRTFSQNIYALREFSRSLRPVATKRVAESSVLALKLLKLVSMNVGATVHDQNGEDFLDSLIARLDSLDEAGLDAILRKDIGPQDPINYCPPDLGILRAKRPEIVEQLAEAMASLRVRQRNVELLHQSALIALLTYFEMLVADMVRLYYRMHPGALSGDTKILSFNELKEFSSIEEAVDYVIAGRVEELLRDSLDSWRTFFLKRLKVDIADTSLWYELVEVYQRRNLLVHNGGAVNDIYLSKVGSVNLAYSLPKTGVILTVSADYLENAIEAYAFAGLRLVDLCWHKLAPADKLGRDDMLIVVINELLNESTWGLLRRLCFHMSSRPTGSESNELFAKVNYWLAMKRLGKWDEVVDEIKGFDIGNVSPRFGLCIHSLLEDADEFYRLLPRAVEDAVTLHSLKTNPAYADVRTAPDFEARVSALFPGGDRA